MSPFSKKLLRYLEYPLFYFIVKHHLRYCFFLGVFPFCSRVSTASCSHILALSFSFVYVALGLRIWVLLELIGVTVTHEISSIGGSFVLLRTITKLKVQGEEFT